MIRVRICTKRCRCHSSCRKSRFSGLGTQIFGKRSSNRSFSSSLASSRSAFGFLTRLALISAGSPIHNSKPSPASSRSNQRAYPVASMPTRTPIPLCCRSIELFGFSLTVVQSSFLKLTSLFNQKRNLLKARVIIYSYNYHLRLLSPEHLVVDNQPSLLGSREPTLFMQSVGAFHEKADPGQEFFALSKRSFHFSVQPSRLCRHPSIRTLMSDFRLSWRLTVVSHNVDSFRACGWAQNWHSKTS